MIFARGNCNDIYMILTTVICRRKCFDIYKGIYNVITDYYLFQQKCSIYAVWQATNQVQNHSHYLLFSPTYIWLGKSKNDDTLFAHFLIF